ncbi:MAG: hypothetical protein QOF51_3336 [Chloroflexota bacterium]|nr:hypothetical protein [Chloroflexota bacterium]
MRRAATAPRQPNGLFDFFVPPGNWHVTAPLVVAAAVLAIFVGATAGFRMAYADRIAPGVHVMGVDVGGRTRDDARSLLEAQVAELGRQPVALRAYDGEWQRTARDLGMKLDADSMAAAAYSVGREGNIVQESLTQWAALLQGQRFRTPDPGFDIVQQQAALQAIAQQIDQTGQDAQLAIVSGNQGPAVALTPDVTGRRLDVAQSMQVVRDGIAMGIASGLPATIDLVVQTRQPIATVGDLRQAQGQAEQMLSGPLTLNFADKRWVLSTGDIAKMMSFDQQPGQQAKVLVDPGQLTGTFSAIASQIEQSAQDARFQYTGGNLRVIRESQDGRTLDVEALKAQIQGVLSSADRTITLPVTVEHPLVASSDGPKLGIHQLIQTGSTSYPGATPEKQWNIKTAAERLNGVVVMPGQMFSFNKEVGPTTLDAGFRTGWGIEGTGAGARTVPSVAGGICQVATTLFQPVFHAGYQIEERNWHLYWITGYGQAPLGMKGLDATVDSDSGLDLKFINTTSDPLLIQSNVQGTTVSFGLYGTKPNWTVQIDGPTITNVVPAERNPVREDEPSMPRGRTLAVESAQDGFDTLVVRTVRTGDEVRTLRLTSHYVPSRNVTLVGTGPA